MGAVAGCLEHAYDLTAVVDARRHGEFPRSRLVERRPDAPVPEEAVCGVLTVVEEPNHLPPRVDAVGGRSHTPRTGRVKPAERVPFPQEAMQPMAGVIVVADDLPPVVDAVGEGAAWTRFRCVEAGEWVGNAGAARIPAVAVASRPTASDTITNVGRIDLLDTDVTLLSRSAAVGLEIRPNIQPVRACSL